MKKSQPGKLFIAIALPQLVGLAGAFFTTPAISTWYRTLVRPSFSPPNWLFAPVWSLLFLMMGIAFYLIWSSKVSKKQTETKKEAIACFLTQLLFNFMWSFLFFGQQMLWVAFAEIILLWVLIALTILRFEKIKPAAAYLMIPYLLWVSFASLLNFAFAWLN